MIIDHTLTNRRASGQEPANNQRRMLIGGAMGVAVAAVFSSSGQVIAQEAEAPNDPFIVLLKGLYVPVKQGQGPRSNLGLSTVHLSDGSYSRTKIYPIFGIAGSRSDDNRDGDPIGNFFVQFTGSLCAYQLPGGAIAMSFDPTTPSNPGFSNIPPPDGVGGQFLEGTFELTIVEATGVYRAFKGGHNHMVDKLHSLKDGSFNEFCFCNISTYQFP